MTKDEAALAALMRADAVHIRRAIRAQNGVWHELICEGCGQKFTTTNLRRFCSHDCYKKMQRPKGPRIIACARCGIKITATSSRHKFCAACKAKPNGMGIVP